MQVWGFFFVFFFFYPLLKAYLKRGEGANGSTASLCVQARVCEKGFEDFTI